MLVKQVSAKKILDSRKEPTIEVSVNGCKASSPSGKSKGKYETPSWHKSLDWNIKAINSLKIEFNIESFSDLHLLEDLLISKFNLKNAKEFGANALFALESAILKALAKSKNKELWQVINENAKRIPTPLGNAIGGGMHSSNKNHPEFQEFLLIPQGNSFSKKLENMNSVYYQIGKRLKSKSKNDEGAWTTSLSNEEVLEFLKGFKSKAKIGIDVASSSFYCEKEYQYHNKSLSRDAQIFYMTSLIKDFDIFYLEDPLDEEDFFGFSKIDKKHLVCGDDLTVTHIDRLQKAIKNKSINAIIIKPNQNGSLLDLKKIFEICKKNRITTILSHRSGETLDDAIADYAFAFQADYIKCGISTKWRESKLQRLKQIEKSQ